MDSQMDSEPFWDADLVRISARRPYQIYESLLMVLERCLGMR